MMARALTPIDDASYQEGRAAFAAGASIRSIIEQVQASILAGTFDDKVASGALGFADALLDHLRSLRGPPTLTKGQAEAVVAHLGSSKSEA